MDDAEYIYKQDVKEKAITARSSHKYGSSRRRRCGLSSDNLTRKEWERMNGPVHTLKPDEALSWDRFRALPRSLQQDYIKHILSKFKVGPAALGRMFGVSEEVFKNEDNGTWYVMARYVNWKGERKQKCKRGFATKREIGRAHV